MSTAIPPSLARFEPRVRRVKRPALWVGGRHLARRGARVGLLVLADLVLLVGFNLLIVAVRTAPWGSPGVGEALERVLPQAPLFGPEFYGAVMLCLALLGGYQEGDREQADGRRVLSALLAVTLLSWETLWASPGPPVLAGYLLAAALLALALLSARRLARWARRVMTPRRLRTARALLVAGGRDMPRARRHPALSDYRMFAVRGVFDPVALRSREALEQLCESVRRCDADTILLCCGVLSDRAFGVVQDAATAMGCALVSINRSPRALGAEPRIMWHRGQGLTVLASPASRTAQRLLKRVVDIVGAVAGLVLLGPVMVLVALAIRFESPGPIFFAQRRVGAWGQPFRCLKFRTMRTDAEPILRADPALYAAYVANNYKLPEGQDPRITRLGIVLRRSSLDELPQFWNVLLGDMSLVGPRPVVPDELNEYGERRRVLLSVKPGMSGAWAITGRSQLGYPRRAAIELRYVRGWRLLGDVSILWRTLPSVLARRGAH